MTRTARLSWLAIALTAACLPGALRAQAADTASFSPDQRQVWQREVTYWKLWKAGDEDGFMELWDPRFVGWPESTSGPIDRSTLEQLVRQQFQFVRAGQFDYELHPLAVLVLGDVAMTYYAVHNHYRAPDGTESSGDSRLTHTWMRTDGTWRIVGTMSAPPIARDTAGSD